MAYSGAGDDTLVDSTARTGEGDTGQWGGLLGLNNGGKIVTLGESAAGGRLGILRDCAGKLGWTAAGGAGRGAMGVGSLGGMSVKLDKMWESAWMAAN